MVRRRRGRRSSALVGIVAAICLTQLWTVPPTALESDEGWVIALASMTLVVYQWHTSVSTGAAAVVIVDGAFFAGVVLAAPASLSGAVTMLIWIPIEAVLSRLLWLLVRRGAAAADQATERAGQARRTAAVAAAARAAEREYSATLHDTAASTLLMVGLGEVTGDERWLRAQAGRDLRVFDGRSVSPAEGDLAGQLREVIAGSGLDVTALLPDTVSVPATVGTALCQAVREALSNVARHARTDRAEVTATAEKDGVVITVTDHGIGFAPELVPATRWGVTESIVHRVSAAGGRVDVRTAPGAGTTVRLEWRRG
jgi:signal transduction histidine kinase